MRLAGRAVVTAVALLACPGVLAAQQRQCRLEAVGGYTHSTRFDSLNYIHRASGGIDYRCSDGTRILADSAVVYELNELVQLFGRVRFEDPDTRLDADTARYFGNVSQLEAWSRVVVTDLQSEAVIEGDSLRYFQASAYRALDRVLVYGGDPHATFHPPPVPVPPPPPPPAGDSAVADSVETDPTADAEADEDAAAEEDTLAEEDAAAEGTEPLDSMQTGEAEPAEAAPADTVQATEVVPTDTMAAAEASPPDSTEADFPDEADPPADAAPVDSIQPPPYDITARRFMIDGRRFFRAAGEVVVERDSLTAVGDSLDFDQDVGTMFIVGGARVEQQGFELTADAVEVKPTTGLNEEILARRNAELVGSEMVMKAPGIRMFLDDGDVNRLVAIAALPPLEQAPLDTTGLSAGDAERARTLAAAAAADSAAAQPEDSVPQPSAFADEFHLTADSIDVLSPARALELVTAVGSARAEAAEYDAPGATELPEIASRDWMEGDTILAHFAMADSGTAGPPPGGSRSRLETLTAVGEARSLYRMTASDTTDTEADRRLALHLVEGKQIRVHMRGREVVKMEVEGQTVGYHLEPSPPDSADVAADSAATDTDSVTTVPDTSVAVPDSAVVVPDSARVRPDTVHSRSRFVRPRRRIGP